MPDFDPDQEYVILGSRLNTLSMWADMIGNTGLHASAGRDFQNFVHTIIEWEAESYGPVKDMRGE